MIITSITGPTMAAALGQMRSSSRYADILEFRLDLIRDYNIGKLIASARRPTIVTCRPVWEGGQYRGLESERLKILESAARLGADYIDVELRAGIRAIARFARRKLGSHLIVSRHYFGSLPHGIGRAFRALQRTGADVVKIAFDAGDVWENALAFEFLAEARQFHVKAIALAMGAPGEPSRILYRKFGGWATYAAPESGPPAAPGQIPGSVLRGVYRSHLLNTSTRVYGLLGNPVAQSRGYLLHNRLFARYDLNAVYCRFLARDVDRFFSSFAPWLHGCSVTTPFKQSVMGHLRVDRAARTIGAVNTIYRRGGILRGTNSDAPAALDAVERQRSVRSRRVLVLGAGGTARAVVYEATKRGARVSVANRTFEKAAAMAREFGAEIVRIDQIERGAYDVVINTSSAGMSPAVDTCPISGGLCGRAVVLDAVYNPPVTRFLREARRAGATIIPGMDMFLRQAAAQCRLFTRKEPGMKVLKGILEKSKGS